MTELSLTYRGPFSLAESTRFLEDFTPARHRGTGDGVLPLALWVEGSDRSVGVAVRQDRAGAVTARVDGEPPPRLAEQLARLLSLDVDGSQSADLVVVRGASAPDVFPMAECRLHEEMAERYGLADPDPAVLARIAERWRLLRTWVAVLLRRARERRTGGLAHRGRRD